MDWTVNEETGKLTVAVTRPNDALGLYRAYAVGSSGGRCLLGTLTPQGDRLTLRRTLGVDVLRQRGCYPVTAVVTELAHPFTASPSPLPGWGAPPKDLPFPDNALRRACAAAPRPYYQQTERGFILAYLWKENAPFPLPILFCFAQTACVCGRRLWLFPFDSEGNPRLDA